jgi:hypothetical protein
MAAGAGGRAAEIKNFRLVRMIHSPPMKTLRRPERKQLDDVA